MSVYNISVNDFNTSNLTNEKEYKSVSIAPSTLLPNPSQAFARAFSALVSEGIYEINYSISGTTLTLTNLKGFLKSDLGIHYVTLLTDFNFDLSSYDDGDYDFYIGYNMSDENDSIVMSADRYVRDELTFEITQSEPTISNPIKIGIISKSGDTITYAKETALTRGIMQWDLFFPDDLTGIILTDRNDNTKKWRLFINDGNLGIEEVE